MKKHAVFSASGAYRWLKCPGSISLSKDLPPPPESEYALEGTKAHECMESILRSYFFENQKSLEKYTEEMIEGAYLLQEYVERKLTKNAQLEIETKVDLDFIHRGMFGTCDVSIYEPFGRLHVVDYKYGAGIAVEPEGNAQLAYYALGLAHKYDWNLEDVALVVIQPRAFHPKGAIRESIISAKELKEWEVVFRNGVKAALSFNINISNYVPGEWCRFCPASHICPALSQQAVVSAQLEFEVFNDDVVLPKDILTGDKLTPEQLGKALEACDHLEIWIDAVRTHAFHKLGRGEAIPGFKLVPKRSTRKWFNEEKIAKEAKKKWGMKAFSKPELLSPAQLEKAVKDKDWVEARVTSVSSGCTVAPESDPRMAVNQIEKDFPAIAGEQQGKPTKQKKGKK